MFPELKHTGWKHTNEKQRQGTQKPSRKTLKGVLETLETKCKSLHFLCTLTLLVSYSIFYIIAIRMFFEGIASAREV